MSRNSDNPLLADERLPPFARIRASHVVPAIEATLAESRAAVERIAGAGDAPTFGNVFAPLEAIGDRIERVFSPVSHLHAVADSPELREAYNHCLPLLSAYASETGQNHALYERCLAVSRHRGFDALDAAERRIVENELRDFRLAGVALEPAAQSRFREVASRLSDLASRFNENVLDATQAWTKTVTDPERLAGLPDSALRLAAQAAKREQTEGWLFNLEFPSYLPVITYAEDESLRRECYEAYVTRASDRGPDAGRFDNSAAMAEILALRHERARLLGYASYAELSLERKMARAPEEVLGFLRDLAARARPRAERELDDLRTLARERYGRDRVEAWDVAWLAEKLRIERYDLSQEALRPWFPLPRVLSGLYAIIERLYGITVRESDEAETWHDDVRFFEIRDADGSRRGEFYLDLFARAHKRGGAWMGECVVRRRSGEAVRTPVAYLNCNFTPPVDGEPAQLTHDEVTTLFHEFGHGLHHLLTRVDYPSVAGINGVAWDAVELPSQFMENWCWERESLSLMSGHVDTGEPLPDALWERLRASRTFQSGMQMLRQLEFALFDFRLHHEYDPDRGARIEETLAAVRAEIAVVQPPEFNRFAHGFTHVFGGGYAAGYYSYKWAELLSSDAFARFEEDGIFNRDTGRRFLESILEQGGSRDPMDLYVEFRGREPSIDALLRHSGLEPDARAAGA